MNAFAEFLREWEEKLSKFPALAGPEWEEEHAGEETSEELHEFIYLFPALPRSGRKD